MHESFEIDDMFAAWLKDAVTTNSRGPRKCTIEFLARQHTQGCVSVAYVAIIDGACIIKVRSASSTCHPSTGTYCIV